MLSFFSPDPCIDFLTLINKLAFPTSVSEALLQMVKRKFLQVQGTGLRTEKRRLKIYKNSRRQESVKAGQNLFPPKNLPEMINPLLKSAENAY